MIDGPFLRAPKFGALDRGALILTQLVEQSLLNLDEYKPSSCTGYSDQDGITPSFIRINRNNIIHSRVSRVLLTSAGPRVAEAIFAHVTSAASTVCTSGVGRRFEDRRLVVGLLKFVMLWQASRWT